VCPVNCCAALAVHERLEINGRYICSISIGSPLSSPVFFLAIQAPPRADSLYTVIGLGNCSPRFMRSVTYTMPTTAGVASSAALPLGVIVTPFAEVGQGEEEVQRVKTGSEGPLRCQRCRAYINCRVRFVSLGNKYVCSVCHFVNDVPQAYFSPLDANGVRHDYIARPELSRGSVDFVATSEYMSRTPAPAAFVFVIDVSAAALASGHAAFAARCVRDALAELANMSEARVGLITYNNHVHFYNLLASQAQPAMLVVPDLQGAFVPLPSEACLVPYSACRAKFEQLLEQLPALFDDGKEKFGRAALGPAVAAAGAALADVGGKVLLFGASLPTAGGGTLQPRDNPSLYGTPREEPLLAALKSPQGDYYADVGKQLAAQRARVDLFMMASDFVDLATLATLAHATGGELYHYPAFDVAHDGVRLARDLRRNLQRAFAFECLLRMRCSEGVAVEAHYGHFTPLNATDLEIAGMDSESTLAVALTHDAAVPDNTEVVLQCATLYTSAAGERLIRVHTLALKAAADLPSVYRTVDLDAYVGLSLRAACSASLAEGAITVARQKLIDGAVATLAAYRKHCSPKAPPGQLILPDGLKLLPVFLLAALRTAALRKDKCYRPDERVNVRHLLLGAPLGFAQLLLYPRLMTLHADAADAAPLDDSQLFAAHRVALPHALPLSAQSLAAEGVYLLHAGTAQYVFIGPQCPPHIAQELFGTARPSPAELTALRRVPAVQPADADASAATAHRAAIIFDRLARRYPQRNPALSISWRGAGPREAMLLAQMVDDAAPYSSAYVEFLVQLHRLIAAKLQ
jgi:protein transport protein SEC24